jgi:hypothetical protein
MELPVIIKDGLSLFGLSNSGRHILPQCKSAAFLRPSRLVLLPSVICPKAGLISRELIQRRARMHGTS